jgi:hypothetical protein
VAEQPTQILQWSSLLGCWYEAWLLESLAIHVFSFFGVST